LAIFVTHAAPVFGSKTCDALWFSMTIVNTLPFAIGVTGAAIDDKDSHSAIVLPELFGLHPKIPEDKTRHPITTRCIAFMESHHGSA
jgi:hypothetical protein